MGFQHGKFHLIRVGLVFRHHSTITKAVIDWESKLQNLCEKIGASHAGLSPLAEPITWKHYENWLEKGYAGEMVYLKTHAEVKKNPQKWKPLLKSAIVVAFPYVDHPEPVEEPAFKAARIALYAKGYDYHYWIKSKLQTFINELKVLYPNELFETHTDSSPLLERDLAKRAGLGWYGKNTCIIHPKEGSLFLIGEILTSLEFSQNVEPLPDFCGKCQKCIEICPTNAITEPHILDASRCISYLTIESKQVPPENIRPLMKDWLFGCDLCQTVCPWNQKVFKGKLDASPTMKKSDELEAELRWLLTSSHNQILKKIKGTALSRAGAKGLKRNALIVIANLKMHNLRSEVEALIKSSNLKELASWTLQQLGE